MDLIQYLRNLIVVKTVPPGSRVEGMVDAPASELEEMEALMRGATAQELQNFFSILMRSEGEIKRSANPWVTLEMTVLKMAYAPDIMDLAEMLRRMDSGLPHSRPKAGDDRHGALCSTRGPGPTRPAPSRPRDILRRMSPDSVARTAPMNPLADLRARGLLYQQTHDELDRVLAEAAGS